MPEIRRNGLSYSSSGDVVDNLESFSTTMALSANQGRLLNKKMGELTAYSTEETVIGTWIDGKPIYRKTINDTIANVNTVMSAWPIDEIIKAYGAVNTNYNHRQYIPCGTVDNSASGSGPYSCQLYKGGDGKCYLQYGTSISDTNNCCLTIEYTKTTD